MNFDEYQALAQRTSPAERPAIDKLTNGALGLGGEAGEVVEVVKKHRYHAHPLDRDELAKELGDVLWYVAELCAAADLSMGEVATRNIDKLRARYPEGFDDARSRNREE
jgi:NTP pyrophosphatase (non-canonical NTP hydrolase)